MNTVTYNFFRGDGEMAKLTRAFDWAATALGPPGNWPQSLRTTISIILNSRSPMFLWWGPGLIQFYNDAYRPSFGNNGKHPTALGQRGEDCWPEIWSIIKPLIDQVLEKGEPTWSVDQLIPIYRNGKIEDVYWTFGYSPVYDDNGDRTGVLVVCSETTENVRNLQKLKQSKRALEQSEDRLRQIVMKTPFILLVLKGPEFVVEIANQALYKYWNKTEEQTLGKPLLAVLPELKDQPFPKLLQEVFETGKAYGENEVPNYFETDQGLIKKYVSYLYEPIIDEDGTVSRILVAAEDMTRLVKDRNRILATEENFRLSLEAAELGRFDMDPKTGTLFWDARCRELFGIDHNDTVTYENDFLPGLHPEDRERVSRIINDVFVKELTNGDYDVEYRTIGVKDKRLRWVRAKGKALFNENDEPIRFIGSVLEITDKKTEEIRRNDFFAMASHELKTPLTSIKSYVQMLLKKAIRDEDLFRVDALNRVNKNVNKMTSLIQGFLNNAKIIEGKFELQLEKIEVYPLLAEVTVDAQLVSPGHKLTVMHCQAVFILADREKLIQVMENLVSNAVKYSPKGGAVTIGCDIKKDHAEIYVEDEGVGINENDQQKLFDRFYRVQNEKVQNVSGFGIGLYLVSEILRYHHSRIMVKSQEGEGSRFYFRLPLAASK